METSVFIDWISFTKFGSSPVTYPDALPTHKEPTSGHNGYTRAFKYASGVTEMFNPNRPDMGVMITYSGKVLERISTLYDVSRDDILRYHTTLSHRVSRIDFAVDLRNSQIDLDELWSRLENKQALTKSGHARVQRGQDKGYTVYVGSQKSRKKLLRVYDKAKEQRDFVSDYKRVELQCGQAVARNATKLYQDSGYQPDTVTGMIRAFCDFPDCQEWANAFNSELLKLPVQQLDSNGDPIVKDSETAIWLMKSVAPAMARVLAEQPEFWSKFRDRVTYHMMSMSGNETEQEF